MTTPEDKSAQFEEFFKINHPINVNVIPLTLAESPSYDDFEARMPHAFKLAGQFSSVDEGALRALKLANQQSETLVTFLNAQAQKIDWMLSYILEQQDDPQYRHNTIEFGAGGIVVKLNSSLSIGSFAELKLFLPTEYSAVYCLGEVIACDVEDDSHRVAFLISHIRESDQELLVRATLHIQTQQLRARNKANEQ